MRISAVESPALCDSKRRSVPSAADVLFHSARPESYAVIRPSAEAPVRRGTGRRRSVRRRPEPTKGKRRGLTGEVRPRGGRSSCERMRGPRPPQPPDSGSSKGRISEHVVVSCLPSARAAVCSLSLSRSTSHSHREPKCRIHPQSWAFKSFLNECTMKSSPSSVDMDPLRLSAKTSTPSSKCCRRSF